MRVSIGRVSSVNEQRHTAQVKFTESTGEFVSYDLQVLVTRPGDYSLPAVDAFVVCLLLGNQQGDGFVLGALYSEADAAPAGGSASVRAVACDDLRLGAIDANQYAAFAQKCDDNFSTLRNAINNLSFTIPVDALTPLTGTVAGGACSVTAGELKAAVAPIADALPSVACSHVKVK